MNEQASSITQPTCIIALALALSSASLTIAVWLSLLHFRNKRTVFIQPSLQQLILTPFMAKMPIANNGGLN